MILFYIALTQPCTCGVSTPNSLDQIMAMASIGYNWAPSRVTVINGRRSSSSVVSGQIDLAFDFLNGELSVRLLIF